MADVSGVSSSGGAHQTPKSAQNASSAANDITQNQQFDDSLQFLQQDFAEQLAMQKAMGSQKG